MSSSIAIPKRKQPSRPSTALSITNPSTPSSSSSPAFSSYQSPSSAVSSYSSSQSPSPMESRRFEKSKVQDASTPERRSWDRRPSLLGSSLSKSEYTVVNLGHGDGPPRLVTCVKSSQGFDWNQELFLPSYMDFDSSDLERRPDPVHEIVLTDEEAAALLP